MKSAVRRLLAIDLSGSLTGTSTVALLLASVFCLINVGCSRDSVTVYESAPKTRILDEAESVDSSEKNFRMLAAICNRADSSWFFKLAGPVAAIESLKAPWDELIKSVEFSDDGKPSWDLPQGWVRGEEASMRFATLKTGDGDEALEVSVSQLPPGQDLLGNINRWRGQLGLGPTDAIQMEFQLQTVTTDTAKFRIFDESGPIFSAGGMGGAPFANSGGAAHPGGRPAIPPPEVEIEYEAPTDWVPGETTSVTLDQWTKSDGDQGVEIAVLQMKASEESWAMNIKAWAEQMQFAEAPDVEGLTETTTVAGSEGRRIRIDEPGDGSAPKSLVAVMFRLESSEDPEGTGWLIKYSGDTRMVDENIQTFEKFIDSITNKKK